MGAFGSESEADADIATRRFTHGRRVALALMYASAGAPRPSRGEPHLPSIPTYRSVRGARIPVSIKKIA